jgi:arylsulfatase A-like enzyme
MTPPGTKLPAKDLIQLAICAGLVAAFGELVVLAVRRFAFHEVLRLSSNVVWMAPLNDAVTFAILGGLLAAAIPLLLRVPLFRRIDARAACYFLCAFVAAAAIVLAIPRLHWAARLMLAIGVAVQATRAAERAPRMMSDVRRVGGVLATSFTLAGIALGTWHVVHERRAIAALAEAAPGAKNVLLIIWDTVRSQSLGLYGSTRGTSPVLDRLATSSITFDRAFATAPWTLPSHGSMFTGHFSHDLSANVRTPLDDEFPTVAERMTENGFATAGFVANGFYGSEENGLGRGFMHYEDFVVSPGEILIATSFGRALDANARVRKLVRFYDDVARRSADDISSSFLHWLDGRPPRPFFAFLNYYDAHEPYLPPEPFLSRYGPQGSRQLGMMDHSRTRTSVRPMRPRMSAEEKRAELAAYEGAIAYLDDRLGTLLDSLDRRGLLANTVVIVSSDHGEHHGEHRGAYTHAVTLYSQELHVPLVIRLPGRAHASLRVAAPVSLRDLAATMLDLAGATRGTPLPGRSLAHYWEAPADSAAAPDTVLSELRTQHLSSIADGTHHRIRRPNGRNELYDIADDPREEHDVANTPEGERRARVIDSVFQRALTAPYRRGVDQSFAKP